MKSILYCGLYIICALIICLLVSSKIYGYIVLPIIMCFGLSLILALIFTFTKSKKIKWNFPLWVWSIGINILIIYVALFSKVEGVARDKNGETIGYYAKGFTGRTSGEVFLALLITLATFSIPTLLLALASWKQKISKKQIISALVVMLTMAPICVITEFIFPNFFENISSILGIR